MPRFFVTPDQIRNAQVEIIGDDVNHINKVLRLKPGAEITVVDGISTEYLVEIEEIQKDKVIARLISESKPKVEAELGVHLIQGLPKGEKIDFILQKCTELGIKSIIPVNTERSVVKLDDKKAEQRVQRWQKIAREAAEQSGRIIVPEISAPRNLVKALGEIPEGSLVLMPWEAENNQGLKEVLREKPSSSDIYLIIGPEGGFSPAEVDKARGLGAIPVSLGPRILRTETAGLAALTMVLYELGDLGG